MARSFWRLIHLCLALGTGYQLSMMGTPTCCLFMCPGLAYKVEILRVTSQERDPAEHSIFFVVVQSLSHVHSLLPHGQQHTRLPCPSPSPRACSNWCPLSQWCYLTISSTVVPFSFCLQSFHQGFFQQVSSSHQVAQGLELQLQHQSFQWIFKFNFL